MQALIKEILASIPKYLSNFLQVLTKPRVFVTERNFDQENALTEALAFVGISIALTMILMAPFRPAEKDFWAYFGGWLLLSLLLILFSAGILRLSWKLVGGKAPFEKLLKVHSYHFGVGTLLEFLVILCAFGVGKVLNPALYNQILSSRMDKPVPLTTEQLFSKALIAGSITLFVGLIIVLVWWLFAWGAYRIVNQSSKGRSLLALGLYTVLGLLPSIAWFFMMAALLY